MHNSPNYSANLNTAMLDNTEVQASYIIRFAVTVLPFWRADTSCSKKNFEVLSFTVGMPTLIPILLASPPTDRSEVDPCLASLQPGSYAASRESFDVTCVVSTSEVHCSQDQALQSLIPIVPDTPEEFQGFSQSVLCRVFPQYQIVTTARDHKDDGRNICGKRKRDNGVERWSWWEVPTDTAEVSFSRA